MVAFLKDMGFFLIFLNTESTCPFLRKVYPLARLLQNCLTQGGGKEVGL